MPRAPTAAELREENARQRGEISLLHMALMLTTGTDPDAATFFNVGDAGARERYTLKLYGALRSEGGIVVQVHTYRNARLPGVSAFYLDELREKAQREAALLCSDFNVKRRDALDQLAARRNDLVREHFEAQKAATS